MLKLEEHLLPSSRRELSEASVEHSIALFSQKLLWHRLFDESAYLLDRLGNSNSQIFEPYLKYYFKLHRQYDFQFELGFIPWLVRNGHLSPSCVDECLELVASAGVRWSSSDLTSQNFLLIHSQFFNNYGILVEKSQKPLERTKTHVIEIIKCINDDFHLYYFADINETIDVEKHENKQILNFIL